MLAGLIFMLVGALILNGFAAGMAAMLYLWRRDWPRSRRIVLSALSSGMATLLLFSGVLLFSGGLQEEPVVMVLVFGLFALAGAAVSLPAALIMSRKIERGPDIGSVFE